MKKLLFDLMATQPNSEGSFHGGGKYGKQIFFTLLEKRSDVDSTLFVYDSTVSLDKDILVHIQSNGYNLIDVNVMSICEIVKTNDIQRIYSALPGSHLNEAIEKGSCDIISTIHGLRFLETKQSLESLKYDTGVKKLKSLIKVLFRKSFDKKFKDYYLNLILKTTVVTVSDHTKYSIMSYFSNQKTKSEIKVFYSPDVTNFSEHSPTETKFEHDKGSFFMIVSGNRWVKNSLRSMLALDELFTDYSHLDQKVIVTGVDNPSLFKKRLKNANRFIFLGYVSEEYLSLLYQNAFCLVYMSLNEGFGYPPLEAMKYGVPVITCPFTSLTEICSDSVIYANPYSVKEIKNRLLWLTLDKSKYHELSKLSKVRFDHIRNRQEADIHSLIDYIIH